MLDPDFITIFTPAYNRGDLMSQLYASLLAQAPVPFEWIIVDDGSTDDTRAVVAAFIAENKIPISYYYKANEGKHVAINFGVQKAKGALFFIVDSDDFLAADALAQTYTAWQDIKDDAHYCGIIGLSEFTNGTLIGDRFLEDRWTIPFVDFYLKYHLTGDKSVAFKTSVLKEYPFPVKAGVRYVFESVVWSEMSKKYAVLCLNTVVQYKEYLEEGISDSSYRRWYLKSMAFSYFCLIQNKTYPFSRFPKPYFWNFIYLGLYSLLTKENYFVQLTSFRSKFLYVFLFPRALFAYFRVRNRVVD